MQTFSHTNINNSIQEGASETLEDEMGLTGATAEDAEAEYIKKICDHEIVTGEAGKCFDITQCR